MLTQATDMCQNCFRYAMDELTLPERTLFERHLSQCEACRQDAAEYRLLRESVEADLAADRARFTVPQPKLLTIRRLSMSVTAAAIALFAFLPQGEALADRLHVTASHVHSNLEQKVSHIDSAAHHLVTRVHLRK